MRLASNGYDASSAFHLTRSTLSGPDASRSILIHPIHQSLGIASPVHFEHPNNHARRHFSSGNSKSQYKTSAKIPTPKSAPASTPFGSINPQALIKSGVDMTSWLMKEIFTFIIKLPGNTIYYMTHPKERKEYIQGIKEMIKKEVDHYWTGSKVCLSIPALTFFASSILTNNICDI